MSKINQLRTVTLAAGILCAAAVAGGATSAMAQMNGGRHVNTTHGWHSSSTWRGGSHWRGTGWNHPGWRGGYWHGRSWHPGWRGRVAVGYYGGYPYYADPYYGYPDAAYDYPYGGYYGSGSAYPYGYSYGGDGDDYATDSCEDVCSY
jgi:hypothetical protein